jgi:hypothetical protein
MQRQRVMDAATVGGLPKSMKLMKLGLIWGLMGLLWYLHGIQYGTHLHAEFSMEVKWDLTTMNNICILSNEQTQQQVGYTPTDDICHGLPTSSGMIRDSRWDYSTT